MSWKVIKNRRWNYLAMWSFWWHCCPCHKGTSTCREGSSIYLVDYWTLLDLQHHPQSLYLNQPALWPPLMYICQHDFWNILIMFISIWYLFLSSVGHSLAIKYLHSIAWAWSSAATVFALEGSTEASAANVFSSWGSCLSSSSSTTEMMKQC